MSSKKTRVLVVEGDPCWQSQLKRALDDFEVYRAATRAEALSVARRLRPPIVLQDLGLPPDPDGVEEGFATMSELLRIEPRSKIIVVTSREGRQHALRAIRMGAYDFCHKPLDARVLGVILDRARRIHDLETENLGLAQSPSAPALAGIIGASEQMAGVCRLIRKLAPTRATVLLLGESGTGKERLARALHALSERAGGPMVTINCAAIPENLLESELFGHERGAFTGAVRQTSGKIERADGGTLFLDEIGDMPPPLQAKVLRFLQERVIERVGGRQTIAVDVRIIAATHRDLQLGIADKTFREDLFYRLSEVSVAVPPLRERVSDAVLIANYLLLQASRRNRRPLQKLAPEAVTAIERHAWPGNVRELENRVNAAAIMVEGRLIGAADLSLSTAAPGAETQLPTLREVRQRAEAAAVRRALANAGGNISKAAELLGVARTTLYEVLARSSGGSAE